jgi:uncharacterized membrane protein
VEASGNSLRTLVSRLEDDERLDNKAALIDTAAAVVASGSRQRILRGDWMGHALHPLLTDLPIGCWASAAVLDLFGGRSSRLAAQRLVGVGLLAVPPTIASGLAEYRQLDHFRTRRVAAVHAGSNAAAALLYFASWRARRQGRHISGVCLSTLAGLCAAGSGYLGGHLSFARGAGAGERGVIGLTRTDDLSPRAGIVEPASQSEQPYVVGSMDDATRERYYDAVVRLKRAGENRSIQGIMREVGESGHQAEVRALDALQSLAAQGRLELVPIVAEWSAVGTDVIETNETHWYEPVE